ncbi:MAG: hypothetical protein M1817_001447 [Caeruleum heppii]|nr:MAG: hypothetical protein M1817_001447 [Caeruleum heppii]
MWFLQSSYPALPVSIVMGSSSTVSFPSTLTNTLSINPSLPALVTAGLATSLAIETVLLRWGPDRMSWRLAGQTAWGMSLVSMLAMEMAENVVDFYLTGGVVVIHDVRFWMAGMVSMTAGFLAALPYNYVRLHGFMREVYLINGQKPGPLIDIDEGDELEVSVKNDLPVESTIHWHGLLQRGTPNMDGVPGVTQEPIPPNGSFTYRFATGDEYGFYWYHSHFRAYYNDAIRGPLMIRPSAGRSRPFETLAASSDELAKMLQAERNASSILLNDWTHASSDEIYEQYFRTGAFPHCVDSILANGQGRVNCLPESVLEAGPGLGLGSSSSDMSSMDMPGMGKRADGGDRSMSMDAMMPGMSMADSSSTEMPEAEQMTPTSDTMSMGSMTGMDPMSSTMPTSMTDSMPAMDSMSDMDPASTMGHGSMPSMGPLSPRGCSPPMMFKPGFDANSLPPESCVNTTSPLLTIPADSELGWLAINLVNSGAVSMLSVSVDAHSMFVYAADGLFTSLQEAKMGAASPSNTTAINDDPASIWMLTNGSAKADTSTLDPASLAPHDGNIPPPGAADVTKRFQINQTDIVTWVVDRYPYVEPSVPIVYGNSSDGWAANTTHHLPSNATVDIVMEIAEESMDMMGHPMHLHGHKFWVLGSGSGRFQHASVAEAPSSVINLKNPPYRDTTELPASGWTVIRYVTDNPGAWLFHCHVQWHLVSGMALVLVEGGDQIQSLLRASDLSSGSVNATSSDAGSSRLFGPLSAELAIGLCTMLGLAVAAVLS